MGKQLTKSTKSRKLNNFFKRKGNKSLRRKSRRVKKSRRGRKSRRGKKRRINQKGGIVLANKPVGYPFLGGDVKTWPGVNASMGNSSNGMTMSNYYPLSSDGGGVGGVDPYFGTSNQVGGKRNTLIPQSIVNLGRNALAQHNKFMKSWNGSPMPASYNSNPTNQPIDKNIKVIPPDPPNIFAIHKQAGKKVAKI